ncbi:hypothetical protein BDR26DRAFT_849366 [Obelidium mucronatum]|nr:hypothetical protein BDR26DRAFT_849366 [Obelidium mucronatum]
MIPNQKFLPFEYPNPLPDIPPGGISPHPPRPLQFPLPVSIFLTALLILYLSVPSQTKLLSLVVAICFSGIEPVFYMMTKEDPITGAIDIAWESLLRGEWGREPHTTYEQFLANLIFAGPIFLIYFNTFERWRQEQPKPSKVKASFKPVKHVSQNGIHIASPHTWDGIQWLRVLLTPILIWSLEVMEGFTLIAAYGWNPAWIYSGTDAWFLGTIKLGYWKYWILLGAVLEIVGWSVLKSVGK